MTKLKGNGVSSGIAIAKVHQFKLNNMFAMNKYATDKAFEIKRLGDALYKADKELENLTKQAEERIGDEHAQIFRAQQMMIKDPEMIKNAHVKINDFNLDAAYAFKQTMSEMIDMFELSDNPYIKERISDLEDISNRVLHILSGKTHSLYVFNEDVILVATDLVPSETINLDTTFIKGIVIEKGSKTSHSAILARNLGIPAITGVDVSKIHHDTLAIIDGHTGDILLEPSEDAIKTYETKQQEVLKLQSTYETIKDLKTATIDHHEVHLAANIGVDLDIQEALDANASGIGLLRTENQYLESDDFPTEDELFIFYEKVATSFETNAVTIRTLDIGGDKNLSYLNMRKELNPFLGNRAIRYSLSYPSLFKTQLRAILRANKHQNIKVMFPMISTLKELVDAKKILDETYQALKIEGHEVNYPKIGMMVEVPSAALGIEKFLPHIDFISIGTNDLIQYMFAADRMNERVAYLYQPYNPILLSTIKSMIDKANKHGIIVSVCGEMAGHKAQSLLLIGLGIKHLSMHANLILENKYLISKTTYKALEEIAEKALLLDYPYEVEALINTYIKGLKN
ncbi:phosphoenolpyruvate--protein phosphotransferase [Acholeplasma laidlawii]|uniref:phosphoenolpyruvate--protein phosphotransferase n=1 Tax=Acholeplasma laidlawii TaxID=2148 RepID=UPI002540FFC1|nr:phosphoenolpyruvate--protein phosphotransferase [Acholeplasma laidlawii]